ncbi:hypothetical protein BDF21DRAFT_463040 [Thamnidium elegans]|uniref:Nitrogen regulatory protein areA GATA-like domain-containing protein n=1 Tax=Thamnidium elegans TaxID=101142 RepID=A0A8H7SY27_9FUNG|nr:hypothetical protein INT48_003252 [Thamnidium elegans]KAI8080455.1 hypothetical protein BDF21DRAFT_463040 [Thamnidium elegans]
MSLLLSDIHLPMLIKSTLSEHSQYNTLPWNNLDQLSCLWGVFTKCKKNIRDGFRLENLSWRLWYRQSVLQKKVEPKTSEDIEFTTEKKQLTRTRSLPDLSQWSHQKNVLQSHTSLNITQKFYIPTPSFELDDPLDIEDSSSEDSWSEEEEDDDEDSLTFTKKNMINGLSVTNTSALSKPVSLLSDMLQSTDTVKEENNSGLRRCQSRYSRLDQFFLKATTTAA